MKKMRKLTSFIMALIMVLGMTLTVFADDNTSEDSSTSDSSTATATTYSITINNSTTGHTYEAYQIFTGDLKDTTYPDTDTTKSTTNVLSNIKWGSNISDAGKTALGDAAAKAAALNTSDDAAAFAKSVAQYLTGTAVTSKYDNSKYTISGLAAGYYLIKDENNSLSATSNDSYTSYIIEVVENSTVAPKSDVPEVEKKVKDTDDSTGTTSDWQDSADYDIGDAVPFKLTATLANNVSAYTTYKIVFHDTLSAGLTYNKDAKVTFGTADVTSHFSISEENGALTISCDNVKAFGATNSSVITVEYTATLNANAVLGSAGNPNKVYLEYSNNPNNSGEGNNNTGKTPEDVVIVFTYQTIINKVCPGKTENEPLAGAEFTLEKYNNQEQKWESLTVIKNNAGTTFTCTGLDDGRYRLTETKTPAGYNSIDPIYFTITATHDVLSDNPALTDLSASQTDANGTNLTTGIVASFTAIHESTNSDSEDTSNTASNIGVSTDIVNQSGVTLPETGGIGTTIIYILGAALLIIASVLLITRKRMSKLED